MTAASAVRPFTTNVFFAGAFCANAAPANIRESARKLRGREHERWFIIHRPRGAGAVIGRARLGSFLFPLSVNWADEGTERLHIRHHSPFTGSLSVQFA